MCPTIWTVVWLLLWRQEFMERKRTEVAARLDEERFGKQRDLAARQAKLKVR